MRHASFPAWRGQLFRRPAGPRSSPRTYDSNFNCEGQRVNLKMFLA
jgi:hypothetical protein